VRADDARSPFGRLPSQLHTGREGSPHLCRL
jgi:hypothetical protein